MELASRAAGKFRAITIQSQIGCEPICCAKHIPVWDITAPPGWLFAENRRNLFRRDLADTAMFFSWQSRLPSGSVALGVYRENLA
jgi:hypothetical protein